ncbi:MAG: hypothetical protein QG622_2296 [Actinomycetota bacterium]|nr:hypothetical protein [Actinomycetota bacterium]
MTHTLDIGKRLPARPPSARPGSDGRPLLEARPFLDGPTAGLVLQAGLLVALGVTVGLGLGGRVAGGVFGLVVRVMLLRAMRRSGTTFLGMANWVTLSRTILAGGVVALTADSFTGPVPVGVVVALAVTALVLDGVDGQVARRTGTSSELGARFDMEADAFLLLVLTVFLASTFGLWVLSIGLMRYGFVVAGRVFPWLTAPLPPRFSRKAVAVVQGVALVAVSTGILPVAVSVGALVLALALLCWSFGLDVRRLAGAPSRYRRNERAGEGERADDDQDGGAEGGGVVRGRRDGGRDGGRDDGGGADAGGPLLAVIPVIPVTRVIPVIRVTLGGGAARRGGRGFQGEDGTGGGGR